MRRRLPAVLALVAALALASGGIARADGAPADPTVTIAPAGGGPGRTLSLTALAGSFDVHDARYTLRSADGGTTAVTVPEGISLDALLSAAGLDGDPFSYVEAPWPNGGGSVYVLADNLAGAGDGPPVVWSDAQGVHLLRPSDGAGDPNAEDDLTFADGKLALELRRGKLLVPRVSVSPAQGRPRAPIVFSASLAGGASLPAGMRFQWYFDGGPYVDGARVTHRFRGVATYKVQLNVVRGTTNQTRYPTIVFVRIAKAAAKRRGGSGGARGTVVPAGGTGAGGAGSGGAATPGADSGGAHTSGRATPAPAASRPRTIAPAPRRPVPPAAPQGRLVSGTLIASASAALPLASGGRAASAAPYGAAARGPLHVPVGAWVAIGLAVLLGLGWALESRHTLPFWQP